MSEIYEKTNLFTSILDIRVKYDLTIDIIFFIPVMEVKYINNFKAVFNLQQMKWFLFYQGIWVLVGLSHFI